MVKRTFLYEFSNPELKARPADHSFSKVDEALDDATIADLSLTTISQMTRDELVRVIRDARLPLLAASSAEHLAFHDRRTLERLTHLAGRCCRHRAFVSQSRWRYREKPHCEQW